MIMEFWYPHGVPVERVEVTSEAHPSTWRYREGAIKSKVEFVFFYLMLNRTFVFNNA